VRVVALAPDLLFGSKVQGMLASAGHEVELCAREEEVWRALPADVLVVDLASPDVDGITLVDSLASGGELHGVRTLGFYSHVDVATRDRAQRVGFDLVVPRSRMAREGADLVARLLPA
jgi:PleD family two-component response regulator